VAKNVKYGYVRLIEYKLSNFTGVSQPDRKERKKPGKMLTGITKQGKNFPPNLQLVC